MKVPKSPRSFIDISEPSDEKIKYANFNRLLEIYKQKIREKVIEVIEKNELKELIKNNSEKSV